MDDNRIFSGRKELLANIRDEGGPSAQLLSAFDAVERDVFRRRPKQCKFLRHVAEAAVLGESLTEDGIGKAVFKPDYDSKCDSNVRGTKAEVAASLSDYYLSEQGSKASLCIVFEGYEPRL